MPGWGCRWSHRPMSSPSISALDEPTVLAVVRQAVRDIRTSPPRHRRPPIRRWILPSPHGVASSTEFSAAAEIPVASLPRERAPGAVAVPSRLKGTANPAATAPQKEPAGPLLRADPPTSPRSWRAFPSRPRVHPRLWPLLGLDRSRHVSLLKERPHDASAPVQERRIHECAHYGQKGPRRSSRAAPARTVPDRTRPRVEPVEQHLLCARPLLGAAPEVHFPPLRPTVQPHQQTYAHPAGP